MKTPDSRVRFQAPSRHYHRHRVEDPEGAWNQWIGGHRPEPKPAHGIAKKIAWTLAIAAFGGLIAVMYYQMS
jgi:hypothetical protein